MPGQSFARRTLVSVLILALVATGSYYLVQAYSAPQSPDDLSPLAASSQAKDDDDDDEGDDDDDDGNDCEPNGGYGDQPDDKCKEKVKICHRTGSNKNPYRLITVSRNALKAHRNHPPKNGRRDIIPAPAQGCPDG
jgi:hypothetical protein